MGSAQEMHTWNTYDWQAGESQKELVAPKPPPVLGVQSSLQRLATRTAHRRLPALCSLWDAGVAVVGAFAVGAVESSREVGSTEAHRHGMPALPSARLRRALSPK